MLTQAGPSAGLVKLIKHIRLFGAAAPSVFGGARLELMGSDMHEGARRKPRAEQAGRRASSSGTSLFRGFGSTAKWVRPAEPRPLTPDLLTQQMND